MPKGVYDRSHIDQSTFNRRVRTSEDDEQRFMSHVAKDVNECWLWTAYCKPNGYAQFQLRGRNLYGHRWAYEHWVGPLPPKGGGDLDHLCRVRHCVNPQHLELVTRSENLLRGIEARTGQKRSPKRACHYKHKTDIPCAMCGWEPKISLGERK